MSVADKQSNVPVSLLVYKGRTEQRGTLEREQDVTHTVTNVVDVTPHFLSNLQVNSGIALL